MEDRRLAAAALALVSVAQACYFVGGLTFGFGFGTIASLVIAISMGIAAYALRTNERTTFAVALVIAGGIQLVDYVQNLLTGGGIGSFFVGFTLVVIGALTVAAAGWRWRTAPPEAPRPRGLRWGAGISCLGAFAYVALNLDNLFSPNVFTIGTMISFVAWGSFALA